MLYEYNKKFYVKPFASKIVEVEISKHENEYDIKPTKRILELTQEIKMKLIETTVEAAYKKQSNTERKINVI